MRYICLFLIMVICAFFMRHDVLAASDRHAPVMYSRTNIIIMRNGAGPVHTPPPLPWQEESASDNSPGIVFDAEVRDAASYYNQQGWYNLNPPSETNAVMLTFEEPTAAPISRSEQHVPLDVLMVDKEGMIVQIIPHLMLAALEEPITPRQDLSAFVFLRGGICEVLQIMPGDSVLHRHFKRPPTVWTVSDHPNAGQFTPQARQTPSFPVAPAANSPSRPVLPPQNTQQNTQKIRPSGALMIPVN